MKILKEILAGIIFAFIAFAWFVLVLFIRGNVVYAAEPNEYIEAFESMNKEDYTALENVCYWESVRAFENGEKGQWETTLAVIETVMNRYVAGEYGATVNEICRAKGQFVCKDFKGSDDSMEVISDAISYVREEGRTVLPSTGYVYFATKKQSIARDHIWVGKTRNGKRVKGKGMYFGKKK